LIGPLLLGVLSPAEALQLLDARLDRIFSPSPGRPAN
jgi:hypothetical protein